MSTAWLDTTLDRASKALLERQHADGHFDGDIDQGTGATAQVVILESYLGVLDPNDAREAARWLSTRMQPDGGFLAYPHAAFSTLTETCTAYGALAVAGIDAEDPRRLRMRGWIDRNGGFEAADPITQAYLVMAGVLPARALPKVRIEHVLLPGIAEHVVRSFMLFYGVTLAFIVPGLLHGLAGGRRSWVTRRAARWIVDYLLNHQNPEGNWAGSQWVTSMALACLKALGVGIEHDAMMRGLASLKRLKRHTSEGLSVISLDADVWDTAMALRVLHRARGSKGSVAEWERRAIDYLLGQQSNVAAPADWTNARPGAPRSGGWAFESGNPLSTDTDTTSVVLLALSSYDADPVVQQALRRGTAWLLSMQHEAGGFGAFSRPTRVAPPAPMFMKRPEPPKGPLAIASFFAKPPFEFVETPSADLTSRVVCALTQMGTIGEEPTQRAIEYLLSQQLGDAWWGRWSTNYLAATSFVLIGLAAAKADDVPAMQRAVAWIERHQNEDGGFGEVNESYEKPELAGHGPSNAYVTGLVLSALCVTGHGHSRAATRAARHLAATQRSDGLWEEIQAVQSMAPPEMFYLNFVNYQTAPIEGLAQYRDVRIATGSSDEERPGRPASLFPARDAS
jgi:squalene-hopene/tetraprenyl-beta-curcumene cyclase